MSLTDPQLLRDDWIDNPALSDSLRVALDGLDDGELESALEWAFERNLTAYWSLIDSIRIDATTRLVNEHHLDDGGEG